MRVQIVSAALAVVCAGAACASPDQISTFSAECERALALSAAPIYMREQSGIYRLEEDRFVLDRESQNGYFCMVVRENYEGVVPQCFDEASRDGHIQVYLDEAEKMADGIPVSLMREERAAGFANGDYQPAARPGVVYMASAYNFVVTGSGAKLHIAPHVMYHAPHMTNDDLGAVMPDATENFGMPFLNASGPLGFMIGFVERATDSGDVEASCEGQLPDLSQWPESPRAWRGN